MEAPVSLVAWNAPAPEAAFARLQGRDGVFWLDSSLPSAAGRWTALVEGGALGLAFAEFAGHFRIDPAAIAARPVAFGQLPVRCGNCRGGTRR